MAEKGGDYIRFNNGIQICWGLKHVDFNSWVQWGSVYETDVGADFLFPKSFNSVPSVSCTAMLNTGSCLGVEIEKFRVDRIVGMYPLRPITNTATSYEISYIAIGNWK